MNRKIFGFKSMAMSRGGLEGPGIRANKGIPGIYRQPYNRTGIPVIFL